MPTPPERLREALEAITIPRNGQNYSVVDYFQLPPEQRGNDEADVVDMRLARVLLDFLGYADRDWQYNLNKTGGRPDYLIAPDGRIAFYLENKNTSTNLVLTHLDSQLRRYAESLTVLGLAFNGRELLATRLSAGRLSPLLRLDIFQAAGIAAQPALALDPDVNQVALGVLVQSFHREKFTRIPERIRTLMCSEVDWLAQARNINESIDAFGESAARLIVRLANSAYTTLTEHLESADAHSREMAKVNQAAVTLVDAALAGPAEQAAFRREGHILASNLGRVAEKQIRALAGTLGLRVRGRFVDQLHSLNGEAKRLDIHYEESLEISRRYERWRDLERRFEASIGQEQEKDEADRLNREKLRRLRFARQCSYVVFVRIFLIRILEDKGLLARRLITDGGLELWVQTVRPRYAPHLGELSSETLIELALGQAEKIAGTLHRHDIYDWFIAEDASILDILEVLHPYNFSQLATDVIGYTYQRFLEETERHRLGHYLTPPAVIDHILDSAGYVADNPEVIGRDVLDPACGSGSFLVHAAVRYRQALGRAYAGREREASRAFLEAIKERFIGIDINPFSCYLARINLLVQALDDIARVRDENAGLGDLQIHNADSLDFQGIRGGQVAMDPLLSDTVHRFKALRAGQIPYVFANPPYINVKNEDLYLSDIQSLPFFADWLHGDTNTYLLFLRIGIHFLAPNGTLAYIVPSTILGDQQSELFRRLVLTEGFRLEQITRFYAERVLFKPVEQATSVIVIRRTAEDNPISIRGGGISGDSAEAIADVVARPMIQRPANDLRLWLSQSAVPVAGPLNPPTVENSWIQIWPIMPEDADYYELWRTLVDGSQLTVNQLFDRVGRPLANIIHQGDVNTTHVNRFHVERDAAHALPLYKGEEVDHLIPINYLPTRGPSGRTPFISPDVEPANMTAPQRGALNELRRIASLRQPEYGFVLHEVAKFRVQRRIAGTYFERGGNNHITPVFPHTVWVGVGLTREANLGLLGLLTSTSVNFAYHFCSTNNHVLMNLVSSLPVPERTVRELPNLAALTQLALDRGGRLTEFFEQAGIDRGRALRTGVPQFDPIRFLQSGRLPDVRMRAWVERGWLRLPEDLAAVQRFSVSVLLQREALNVDLRRNGVRPVVEIWRAAYGDKKWNQFEALPMPDDPVAFLAAWATAEHDLNRVLGEHQQSISDIDEAVADLYDVPANLRDMLRTGPPWLAGREAIAEADDDDENEQV